MKPETRTKSARPPGAPRPRLKKGRRSLNQWEGMRVIAGGDLHVSVARHGHRLLFFINVGNAKRNYLHYRVRLSPAQSDYVIARLATALGYDVSPASALDRRPSNASIGVWSANRRDDAGVRFSLRDVRFTLTSQQALSLLRKLADGMDWDLHE